MAISMIDPQTAMTAGLAAFCAVSVLILWLSARTRLYGLYLLKSCWVGATILGFLWIFAMSCADPGPNHGGQVQEFMTNPAGPLAVLAQYPGRFRALYRVGPWILAALAVLSVLANLLWARPASWRRWCIGLLFAAALAPLALALKDFDWSRYGYARLNYAFAWKTARMGDYVLNSLMVSILSVGITALLASMAAYALSRVEFAGRNVVLYAFIGAMMIPAQLYIVPLFLMIQNWHFALGGVRFNFMDSRLGLSLIYAAGGLPFAIFILTGFYRTLPGALGEVAATDGCGEWRTFTSIYFPLAMPGLVTVAIFRFLAVWNEYHFALVFLTNDNLKTLPIGLYNLSVSQQYAANWPALFAGVTILCLPTFLIFVILQERIVAGLTVGAVKQ
jgi:N-acetylglucosamine transport system permease protein